MSDWSSDVCSSGLPQAALRLRRRRGGGGVAGCPLSSGWLGVVDVGARGAQGRLAGRRAQMVNENALRRPEQRLPRNCHTPSVDRTKIPNGCCTTRILSEERRAGKECVRPCSTGGSRSAKKK